MTTPAPGSSRQATAEATAAAQSAVADTAAAEAARIQAVPVVLEATRPNAHAGVRTVVIPAGGFRQLLGRDMLRQVSRIIAIDAPIVVGPSDTVQANVPAAPASAASSQNTGSQTEPGAGTVIASLALPGGTYTIAWTVQLSGTLGTNDANNFGLYNGATQIGTSLNPEAAGSYPQLGQTVVIPAAGATVSVKNIAASIAATVYGAQLVATPVVSGVVSSPAPQGGWLPAGLLLPWTSSEPLYAAETTGTAACRVTVIHEATASQ